MDSRISQRCLRILASLALVSAAFFTVTGQEPDPNSPAPILLSEKDSTRALAQPTGKIRGRTDLERAVSPAFSPEEKVDLFVTNLDLMDGEGANAFRVYALDKVGHQFRFPVIGIEEVAKTDGVFRVTIVLKDEIGFWDAPVGDGDVLVYIAWRGLASNSVRLGLGKIGGDIREEPDARPTPLGGKRNLTRPDAVDATSYRWSGDRFRLAEQATFGPNLALDNKLRRIGVRSWLNEQFAAQYPSASNPYPSDPLKTSNTGSDPTCDNNNTTTVPDVPLTCFRDTYTQYQPQTWFFREAAYGDAQLRHRVSWALSQIWVTSGNDIQQGRHIVEWNKVLAKHAFGNYRDLMKEMTLNPTMGDYLNMRESTRTNPNENYPREIMQLFTIGLFMLNQDGTLQRDAQNNPIPTYTQDTVNNLTRVLTGWGFCSTQGANCPSLGTPSIPVGGLVNYIDPMLLNAGVTTGANNRHDIGAKSLLAYPGSAATSNIAACPPTGTGSCGLTCPTGSNCSLATGATNTSALAGVQSYANASLDQALDNIFNHPNVGPFVGKILIQHLVTSDPSPAYVARVAASFNNNGSGVRGDMKAVIRAILLDPEARGDVKTDPNFGKLREPVLYATNFLRTFNVRGASGSGQFDGYLTGRGEFNGMAQIPFIAPTVFNFYPPDYGIPGTTLLGPEFAIMTTGTAIQRTNFINRFAFTVIPIPVSQPNSPTGLSLDFADLQALAAADTTNSQLLDELNRRMLHSTMTAQMKSTIQTAVNSITVSNPPTAAQTLSRVQQAVYLVATSSQYQVQR